MHLMNFIYVEHICTGKAFSSGNQYYFFSKVNGNRSTEIGYWKEIGVTEPILSAVDEKVGIKKYLVFYIGEPPQGTETSWMMQEYHICSSGLDSSPYPSAWGRRKPVSEFSSFFKLIYEPSTNLKILAYTSLIDVVIINRVPFSMYARHILVNNQLWCVTGHELEQVGFMQSVS